MKKQEDSSEEVITCIGDVMLKRVSFKLKRYNENEQRNQHNFKYQTKVDSNSFFYYYLLKAVPRQFQDIKGCLVR